MVVLGRAVIIIAAVVFRHWISVLGQKYLVPLLVEVAVWRTQAVLKACVVSRLRCIVDCHLGHGFSFLNSRFGAIVVVVGHVRKFLERWVFGIHFVRNDLLDLLLGPNQIQVSTWILSNGIQVVWVLSLSLLRLLVSQVVVFCDLNLDIENVTVVACLHLRLLILDEQGRMRFARLYQGRRSLCAKRRSVCLKVCLFIIYFKVDLL